MMLLKNIRIKYYLSYILLLLSVEICKGERVLIEGEYRYNYSDNETLIEAKSLCFNMALRNALEGYTVFISSTTTIQNLQLRNDLIQTLSSGYIENLQVLSEEINDNSVYYKLKGYVNPRKFKKALDNKVKMWDKTSNKESIADGKYLTIIGSKRDGNKLKVIYKKKGEHYEAAEFPTLPKYMRDSYDFVCVDWFDDDGFPINGIKNRTE